MIGHDAKTKSFGGGGGDRAGLVLAKKKNSVNIILTVCNIIINSHPLRML